MEDQGWNFSWTIEEYGWKESLGGFMALLMEQERNLRVMLRYSSGVVWAKVKPFLPFSLFLLLPVVPLTPANK